MLLKIFVLCFATSVALAEYCHVVDVYSTKLFVIPIAPDFDNWMDDDESFTVPNQLSFRAFLLGAPDLPPWMHYLYSDVYKKAFLYGSPMSHFHNGVDVEGTPASTPLEIELISLSKKDYQLKKCIIKLNVIDKPDKYINQVDVKIDNWNVEDFFDETMQSDLLDVFRQELWTESADDLYITFLASAVQLGARLPLEPTKKEGVVIKLGSRANFSTTLFALQEEVMPIQKQRSYCSNFKFTTVERFFRDKEFILDWCLFKMNNIVATKKNSVSDQKTAPLYSEWIARQDIWEPVAREQLPEGHNFFQFSFQVLLPATLLIGWIFVYAFFFYDSHDGKMESNAPDITLSQYEAVHRATSTLRSMSNQRDTDRAKSEIPKDSPPLSSERSSDIRPNPPPYAGSKLSSRVDF